jgi:hypothetical protein
VSEPVQANLERVREAIARACERAGRSVDEVLLIAVSKTVEAERIRVAVEAGVTHYWRSFVGPEGAEIALASTLVLASGAPEDESRGRARRARAHRRT